MGKKKLTLSVDEDLLREARSILVSEGRSLSSAFEEFLESIIASRWIEELAKDLDLGELDPIDPYSIPNLRPKGFDAAKIVRELRDRRVS